MSNILLLEDDLSLINGLSFALKKQGFELVVARTLKEADSLWTDGKYALLVLDVSLPDGTGSEFCKKVRQVSKFPIIFLTAADEEVDIICKTYESGELLWSEKKDQTLTTPCYSYCRNGSSEMPIFYDLVNNKYIVPSENGYIIL